MGAQSSRHILCQTVGELVDSKDAGGPHAATLARGRRQPRVSAPTLLPLATPPRCSLTTSRRTATRCQASRGATAVRLPAPCSPLALDDSSATNVLMREWAGIWAVHGLNLTLDVVS